MKIKTLLAALCLFSTSMAHANPMQYDFSYTSISGDTLSGALIGDLQSDDNTIVVSSVLDFVKLNGQNGPSLPIIVGLAGLGIPASFASVSLDGTVMGIVAISTTSDGFGFLTPNSVNPGSPYLYQTAGAFGDMLETYFPVNWSITPVPEPATLALLGLGLIGLGVSRRKLSS